MGGIYFFYLKAPPKAYFFIFLFIIAVYRKVTLTNFKGVLLLIFIVFFIFITQRAFSGRGTLTNLLGYIIPILNAYIIIKLIGNKFFKYFVNVVYVFAIIGLFFWLLENLIPSFNESIPAWVVKFGTDPSDWKESLILFAYEPNRAIGELIIRNNGGFWEPGAYVTTLVPAFFFSSIINGINHKKSWIILITILTTFSTTGYIALFVIIIYNVIVSSYSIVLKNTLIISFVLVSVFAYFSLDFLSTKINQNIEYAQKSDLTTPTDGRFIAFNKSIYAVEQNPLIGENLITLREIDYEAKDWVGYGWMDLVAKIGLVFFSWYLLINYSFYKRLVRANSNELNYKILALIPFLAQYVLLFGQALYAVPLYLIFLVFPLIYKNTDNYKITY